MTYRYTVILEKDPEEGGYTVSVTALPGCVTEGDTVEEALAMAKEAIVGHLETLALLGKPYPTTDVTEVHLKVQDTDEVVIS